MSIRFEEAEFKQILVNREMKQGRTLKQALDILSESKHRELFRKPSKEKKLKHGNVITTIDGIKFRSKKEANYYCELKLRMKGGGIIGFVIQPKFILQEGNETDRAITYSADFLVIFPDNTCEVVDTKGYESKEWQRTYKMFRLKYPNIELKVVK
jgi:hypothetical protein